MRMRKWFGFLRICGWGEWKGGFVVGEGKGRINFN